MKKEPTVQVPSLRVDEATVILRVYKGKKAYDENGKMISQNQKVSLPYGSKEWHNFVMHAPMVGFTAIDVTDILVKGKSDKTHIATLQLEHQAAFGKREEVLTPDQKRIKELETEMAELKSLLKGGAIPAKKDTSIQDTSIQDTSSQDTSSQDTSIQDTFSQDTSSQDEISPGLLALQQEFEEVVGRKPHPRTTPEKLRQAIKEAREANELGN